MATRRNVIWWKLHLVLVAQYHADRILLGYTRLLSQWQRLQWAAEGLRRTGLSSSEVFMFRAVPVGMANFPGTSSELAQYLVRLRRGYAAIRSALDYRLPRTGKEVPPWPWLYRTWAEMTLSSYAVGALLLECARHSTPDFPVGSESQYVLRYLEWLNRSTRLVERKSETNGEKKGIAKLVSELPKHVGKLDHELYRFQNDLSRTMSPLVVRERLLSVTSELVKS